MRSKIRLPGLAAALTASVMLAACAGTDVELKGGVFDALGVSGNLNGGKRTEPKMANRPGLVVPPTTASLPPPGERAPVAVASNGESFPVNAEDADQSRKAQQLQAHLAFCEKARERHKQGMTPIVENGPLGSCEESVLRNFTGKDLGQTLAGSRPAEPVPQ